MKHALTQAKGSAPFTGSASLNETLIAEMIRNEDHPDIKRLMALQGVAGYTLYTAMAWLVTQAPGRCFSPERVHAIPQLVHTLPGNLPLITVCTILECCVDLGLLTKTCEGYKLPPGSPFEGLEKFGKLK